MTTTNRACPGAFLHRSKDGPSRAARRWSSAAAACALAAGLTAGVVASAARAEDAPAQSPLSGPRVAPPGGAGAGSGSDAPQAGAATLVRTDFNGRLVRLDRHPAEAALDVLDLDAPARAEVEGILRQRAAILDRVVLDNLENILRFTSALGSGDLAESGRLLGVFMRDLQPLTARGTLQLELGRALDAPRRRELDRLVGEYFNAVAADGVYKDGQVVPGPRGSAIAAEQVRLFGVQVQQSIERQLGQGEREVDAFLAMLELTPEQEKLVRGKIAAFVERTKLKPTEADKRRLFVEVFAWLNAQQQRKVLEHIAREEAENRAAKPAPRQPTPPKRQRD